MRFKILKECVQDRRLRTWDSQTTLQQKRGRAFQGIHLFLLHDHANVIVDLNGSL